MKALIMAAGIGQRISRDIHGQPKCCLEIGGKALIKRTFEQFFNKGIENIGIVTGYREKYILQALEGSSFRRYYNPFFRITNSIASAWFAREFLTGDDDLLIMNGDVFIEDGIIDMIINDSRSPLLLADSTRIEGADYRFAWDNSMLKRYGKDLTDSETTGEYVGLAKLDKEYVSLFKLMLVDCINAEDYNCWWEDVIYRTVNQGAAVYIHDVAGSFWAEVDYIEDYLKIQKYLKSD